MKWKEFLKPDKKKIVLTLILLILYLLFSVSSPYSFCAANFGGFSCGFFALFGILSLPIDFLVIGFLVDFFGGYMYWGISLLVLFSILTIFYFYLISCLIIHIYNKLNLKKKIRWIILILIVLFVVLSLLIGPPTSPHMIINQGSAKISACGVLMRNVHCNSVDTTTILFDGSLSIVPKFDANEDGNVDSADTLQALCETYFGISKGNQVDCRRICGCV